MVSVLFMFNNIVYFIIVLLIFHIDIEYPSGPPETSLSYTLGMVFFAWLAFAAYCRLGVHRLLERVRKNDGNDGRLTGEYQRLVFRTSILAIVLFAVNVHVLSLKAWLRSIPGLEYFSALEGLLGISIFFLYLFTIWFHCHSAYEVIFQDNISRRSFVLSHFRLNMPVLFPWLLLTFSFDLLAFTPWGGPESFLNSPIGLIVFFTAFLMILMVFLPELVRYWWGCRPFAASDRIHDLKEFLQEKGLRYRNILRWPIFEGRLMTAAIMGIVPRYRYILITDKLMGILSQEELKAVAAHEMGHAKHRHLLYYIVFILGYMVVSFGLFDIFVYFFAAQPFILEFAERAEGNSRSLFQFLVALPILLSIFVYFRYVIGFFMRNFERQADLHSALTMETPRPIISSLEKIALLSGKNRELPSWHHFSIKERVDYLWRFFSEPGLVRRHNRFLRMAFVLYLICIIGLGYFVNSRVMRQNINYALIGKTLEQQLAKEPDNIALHENVAMIYHEMGRLKEAVETYKKVIRLDPSRAVALNNLAWIMVTAPDKDLRDQQHALALAKEAVKFERSPVFLDTLAEAYYKNGMMPEAVDTIKEAISAATENRGYYEKQLEKFQTIQPL
ncbi:MAG: M48 family metalloprotease [Deltaproteobacteria bacterium]|nr:M48 family metalloprotease [Deltaproteobacteria bacterium]